MSAHVDRVRPAGPDHQVVTVAGGDVYRRRPCGGPTSTPERPGCPWRVDAVGHFPPEAFEHSAETAHDMSTHEFACHESGTDRPATCAGYLLRGATHNLAARMRTSPRGQRDLSQVDDGGHELHAGYITMALANGVDPVALRGCRYSPDEEEAFR